MLNSFYDKFIFTSGLQYTHNNFFLLNMPFTIIPIDILVGLAEMDDKDLNIKLYYSVKESVKNAVRKDFQIDFGVQGEKGLDFMQTFFSASGWGKIDRTDLDLEKCHALVSVANSPIAMNCKKCQTPADTFLRGILAGIFSIYFKKDVECVESNCAALHANQCDFVIKPIEEFDFTKTATRGQLKVD
ncbi:MAG TPA: 4-vinyl reductase [archaeon]|nr:4-vinyl reductase [archaeon]